MDVTTELKLAIRNNPWMFRKFWPRKEHSLLKRRVVRPGDDAVIEGFPRSANSFASIGFDLAQPDETKFGNHFHSPAQFLLARKYGVPAMLVIREPVAAARSYVLFTNGAIGPREALVRYIGFHRPLMKIADSFSVAPFEEVTTDLGRSIKRLNEHFGSEFLPFVHTEKNVQRVFDTILERRTGRIAKGVVEDNPMSITMPSEEKARRNSEIAGLFDNPVLDALKARATEQHHALVALAKER